MRYSPTIVEDILQQWTQVDPATGKLVVDFGKLTPESMASFYILPGAVLTALAEAAETSLITPLQIDDAAELRGRDLIDIFNSILGG